MRKAVGLALDGQSTTRVAQEFGIPARTLRRYVATAKKANGLPETAATDRPTHAPSKKKKASLESDSGSVHSCLVPDLFGYMVWVCCLLAKMISVNMKSKCSELCSMCPHTHIRQQFLPPWQIFWESEWPGRRLRELRKRCGR